MKLINETAYPALLFRTVLGKKTFAASAIIRVTYDIRDGEAIPSVQPMLPLSEKPMTTQFGPLESDLVYKRGGIDLMVFGNAIAPNGRAVQQMEVHVRVKNKIDHRVLVIGDRFWKASAIGLSMTNPIPFKEMPLSLFNAFGGKATWDKLEIPYASNEFGKGYYWDQYDAIDKPLPNLENPKKRISSWKERPEPVGFVQIPMNGMRMKENIEFEGTEMKKIKPRFYNAAFPEMILNDISPGEQIEIGGVTPSGRFVFTVPKHDLPITLKFGDKTHERKVKIDQIGIFPQHNKAFITYRFPFRYTMRPMEKRKCIISEN